MFDFIIFGFQKIVLLKINKITMQFFRTSEAMLKKLKMMQQFQSRIEIYFFIFQLLNNN